MNNPLLRFKEIADKLPTTESKAPAIEPPPGQTSCACGKKFMPVSEIKFLKTQYCTATDHICNGCVNNITNASLIVCVRCKAVVARLAPHRTKNGFTFEPGKPYHTPYCPNCQPDCVSSPIAEERVWDESQKRK